jgi:hypothetical protein
VKGARRVGGWAARILAVVVVAGLVRLELRVVGVVRTRDLRTVATLPLIAEPPPGGELLGRRDQDRNILGERPEAHRWWTTRASAEDLAAHYLADPAVQLAREPRTVLTDESVEVILGGRGRYQGCNVQVGVEIGRSPLGLPERQQAALPPDVRVVHAYALGCYRVDPDEWLD